MPFCARVPNDARARRPAARARTLQGLHAKQKIAAVRPAFEPALLKLIHAGKVLKDEETGQDVMHFEGDHGEAVKSFLLKEDVCNKDNVKVHRF